MMEVCERLHARWWMPVHLAGLRVTYGMRMPVRAMRRARMMTVALSTLAGAAAIALTACGKSRAADAGGDTALARDLAIVQMETNRARDSAAQALAQAASTPTPRDPADSTTPPPLPVDSASVASQIASAAAIPAAPSSVVDTPVHIAHTASDPCDAPDHTSQLTCLRRQLTQYDAPLNRTYQRYIERLSAAPASRGGGAPAVNRLRESQRAWLVYRDEMCARRLKGKEPKLWAPGRAACLGEYASARTKLLTEMLSGAR